MADWKYPTGAYKAYVPKGRGMRAAMGGLREGVEAFTSQMLAIRQYEAEQEAKRQKAEQDRQDAALKAAFEQEKFAWTQQKFTEQQTLDTKRLELDELWRGKQMAKIDADIAKLRSQIGDETQFPKNIDKIYKSGLPVKSAYANSLYNYITEAGSYGYTSRDWSWFDEIEPKLDDPQMLTYKESQVDMLGFPVEKTRAATDMAQLSNMYYQIALSSNAYRDKPKEFTKPEFMPQKPTVPMEGIQYKADRARAIKLLKAGDDDNAQKLMEKYNMPIEEVKKLYKEAGIPIKE